MSETTVTFFDCDAPDCGASTRSDSEEAERWWSFSICGAPWGDEGDTPTMDGHACTTEHFPFAAAAIATTLATGAGR